MVKISDVAKELKSVKTEKSSGNYFVGLGKQLFVFKARLGDRAKERFFSELSMLLESGIDIHTAISLIFDGASNSKERLLFGKIKNALIDGDTFNGILYSTSQFSKYDCAIIRIGEQTGQLFSVLSELAIYYFKKVEHKKLLIKALSYPIMVLVTAIAALFFMLSFVVPMFEDVFMRSGDELPAFTQFIINVSVFFREDFVIVLGVLSFFGLVLFLLKGSPRVKSFLYFIVLKTPLLGRLLRLYYLEKLFHSLALLSKAKVPIHEALKLVNGIVAFGPINKVLGQVYLDVMKGEGLAPSMGASKFFEERMVLLIKIGEEVNCLDDIFEKLYQQQSRELEYQISQFGNALEPILIILVGFFVGFILVAMYLPIFQLGTSVF